MRIAYICADRGVRPAGAGGSATHVRELVRALVDRGSEVTVMSAAAEGASSVLPCTVVDLQADRTAEELHSRLQRSTRELEEVARSASESYALLLNQPLAAALANMSPAPDVIYERQSLWSVAGLDFARRRGIPHLLEVNAPLVDQEREYRQLDLTPMATAIEGFLLSGSDRVLATSPALVTYARRCGASRRNVRVVPCGVAASMLERPRLIDPVAGSPARFVIGFVGSLKPWHGLDVLLRAFRELHAADFCYRLLIVGDGPMRSEVERYLRVHGLDAFTEMTGNVDPGEIPGYLARMDVGVASYPELPSFYFSPLKIWEYAAAGIPIVASAVGELARLFPHREAALLHRPGNAGKLAAHIQKLRRDPSLAQRLARRARKLARAHTWDRIAARVEQIASDAMRTRQR